MLGLGKVRDYTMDNKVVNQIRSLGVDIVKEANSGHTGIVLSAAPIIYTLYTKFLKFNPEDDKWLARDRFVLSCGHGSALLYSTLFFAGYDISLDDLKSFRKKDSITPGHPEYLKTPGVEATTGPLGQGIGMAVGMAISQKYLNEYYKDTELLDYSIYCMCGDGDLMEGVSYEAASLAGTLKLDNLILLYDSNDVCLDSKTSITFNDDVEKRFESMNWSVFNCSDSVEDIEKSIQAAKDSDKPSIVIVKTTLGKYSSIEGTNKAHGAILSDEEISNIKNAMDVRDVPFAPTEDTVNYFRDQLEENKLVYEDWQFKYNGIDESIKDEFELIKELKSSITLKNVGFDLPENEQEETRVTSGKVLNGICDEYPLFMGGSADLSSSNKTYLLSGGDFSKDNYLGKNIFFGVREHAMGAIANGIALSGIKVFISTFLTFSDYLKPAIRLAALMNLPVIYVFTHDSVTVGEDGPTHQPIEQLIGLRSIPNLDVYRPADANEVVGSYKSILDKDGPSAIILGRNPVPICSYTNVSEVENGAYIVREEKRNLDGVILSCGEELDLCYRASDILIDKNIDLRIVSVPSIEKFNSLSKSEQEKIIPGNIPVIAVERGSAYSWYKFTNKVISIDNFGISASLDDINKETKFTVDDLVDRIKELLK